MVSPIKKAPQAPSATKSPEIPISYVLLAEKILGDILKHMEANKGEIDYEKLANGIIDFFMNEEASLSRDETTLALALIGQQIKIKIGQIKDQNAKKLNEMVVTNLFTEIGRQLYKDEEPRPDPSIESDVSVFNRPIPNGSLLNSTKINLWHRFYRKKGVVNAGVYRSGDPGVAATVYAATKYDFFSGEIPYLRYSIIGGTGLYSIFPDYAFEDRYIIGINPALQFFLGSEQELFWGIKAREAFELDTAINVGLHDVFGYGLPIKIGLSLGKSFMPDTIIALGARSLFSLGPNDIQDISSIQPKYHDTTLFLSGKTPIVDFGLGFEFHNNETSFSGVISRSFPLLGGLLTFSLAGGASLQGEWVAYPPHITMNLGYDLANRHGERGISADIAMEPTYQLIETEGGHYLWGYIDYFDMKYGHSYDWFNDELEVIMNFDPTGKEASCVVSQDQQVYSMGVKYFCKFPVTLRKTGYMDCYSNDGINLYCSGQSENFPYHLNYQLTHVDSPNSNREIYIVNNQPTVEFDDPLLITLSKYDNYNAFASSLANVLDEDEKLFALNYLAKLAYETYDGQGLVSASGSGKVNTIGYGGIYENIRNLIFNPSEVKKTTVCRGFAKFIAHTADIWGFEAHAVSINSGQMGHVIAMIRKPGEDYRFINRGNGIVTSYANTALEALLAYSRVEDLPPQLEFNVYDSDGKFERSILTNEGRLLKETTQPADKLEPFLQFTNK